MSTSQNPLSYDNKFFILQEDRGSFLRISIPGQVPDSSDKRIIHWSEAALSEFPRFIPFDTKKQKHKEITAWLRTQKRSRSTLPQKSLPGYSNTYLYDFQYAATSDICRDPDDIVYVRNDVHHYAKHMLWFQIDKIIKDKKDKFSDIQIELPVFPQIITEDFYKDWYENNQQEMRFLAKTLEKSDNTIIEQQEKEDCFVLKFKNHSFANQPVKRIQLCPTTQQTNIVLDDKEYEALKTTLLKRDARMLSGLTNRERRRFARGQKTEETSDLHIHWIHWDFLNGEQTKENALLISSDIQTKYRLTIEQPFIKYWEHHQDSLSRKGKPVFIDVPIPMNGYRHKPIQKEHIKPQERRFINRQERHKLNLMTYHAGRTYGDD